MKKDLTNVIGYIYKITSPNGKIYIGQTINKKQRRYHYNKGFYKGQIKLWNSTQKHNWNPFDTFEVIEECLCGENKCYLNEREKHWIQYFDSFKNGLNCNEGGFGNTGYIASEETKNKISKYHKNKPPMSDETKEKLRQINLGSKNPMYNKNHSLNSIEKMKLKLIGQTRSEESKIKMSESAKNKPPMSDETKEKLRQINLGKTYDTKPIQQIDENGFVIKTWDGITKCALELNLNISGISKVLTGKSKTTKGYRFKYNN
jgi:group I intron endonuclease